jgi:HEAT repeat protein
MRLSRPLALLAVLSLLIAGCGLDSTELKIRIVTADNMRTLAQAIDEVVAEGGDGVSVLTDLLDYDAVEDLYLDNVSGAEELDDEELLAEVNRIRIAAVRGLAEIGSASAASPLHESAYGEGGAGPSGEDGFIAEQNARFREEVITALGNLNVVEDEDRIEVLTMLEHGVVDPDPGVRSAAAGAIANLHLFKANLSLNQLSRDEVPAVRAAAVQAITTIAGYYQDTYLEAQRLEDNEAAELALSKYETLTDSTQKILIKALDDNEPAVRIAAARGLRRFDDLAVIEPLVERLDDANERFRIAALETLTQFTAPEFVDETVAQCGEELTDRGPANAQKRMMAALVLGRLSRGAEQLAKALEYEDEFWFVKLQLINALGNIGEEGHLDIIREYLDDPDLDVAKAAVMAVGQLGGQADIDVLIELSRENPELSPSITQSLTELAADEDLLVYLEDDETEEVRLLVLASLSMRAAADREAPDEVVAILADSDSLRLVSKAVDTLAGYDYTDDTDELVELFNREPDSFDDYAAAAADAETLTPVLDSLYALRIQATRMLLQLDDNRTGLSYFIDQLDADSEGRRILAIEALGRIGHSRGVMPVVDILNDPTSNVRWAAANVLADFADQRTISFLTRNLGEGDVWTNVALIDALLSIGDKNTLAVTVELLSGEGTAPETKLAVLNFVRRLRDRGFNDAVAELLSDDEHPMVQFNAAQLLAGFGDERGINFLAEALDSDEPVERLPHHPAETPYEFGLRLLARELTGAGSEIQPEVPDLPTVPAWTLAIDRLTEIESNKLYSLLAEKLTEDDRLRGRFLDVYNGEIAALTPNFDSTAFESFAPLLLESDTELRLIGIQVLSWIGDATSLNRLLTHLDEEPADAPAVIDALAANNANTRLRELFRTADEPVRVLVARYMAGREDKRMVLLWGQIATATPEQEPSLAVRWEVLEPLAADTTGVGDAYLQVLVDNTAELYPPELSAAAAAALAGEPLPPVPTTEEPAVATTEETVEADEATEAEVTEVTEVDEAA